MNDATSYGASCLRKERATKAELQRTADEILLHKPVKEDGSPKQVIGYVLLPVALVKSQVIIQVRKIPGEADQNVSAPAFGVYATGVRERPNHAEIFIVTSASGEKVSRSARNRSAKNLSQASTLVRVTNITDLVSLGG
jgi:hypothetical protein